MANDDKLQEAKDYAFMLLSYRDRTRQEIIRRLKKKKFNQQTINQVLTVLERLNYIDDAEFTRKWIKDRINYKPRGKNLIRKELRDKGVEEDIVNRELEKLVSEKIEKDMGKKLSQKWLKRNKGKDNYIVKLKRYLQNRGFNYSIIMEIIDLYDM